MAQCFARSVRLGGQARSGVFLERFRQKKKVSLKKEVKGSGKEFVREALILAGGPIEARTPEEQEHDRAMVKEYHFETTKRTHARQADESTRLKMKMAAIEALPGQLRDLALVDDWTEFPPMDIFTDTPPIPGFTREKKY
eukprot:TRINITY_DN5206_c0_g1_i1.p2 TRINITY_DN5206_c0_g1~~TRINITY_DN5206_c0_g1_i1.p2  ORF type:complete len:154 (-),score=36.50 TRINITY_DN5206_c0_g1_i1:664-1083(-)